MKKLRLLLVDDQGMFREGLRTLLSLQRDFEIVGEARDPPKKEFHLIL